MNFVMFRLRDKTLDIKKTEDEQKEGQI